MGEAAAAGAQGAVLHRRIEFHAATTTRQPQHAAAGAAGGFRVETLCQGPDRRLAAARSEGREKGEAAGGGFDRELAAARVYLRRIGAGLRNLGNTCYLNSVLQCLTYTEPFVAYLQSGKHKSSCRTAGFCALCALQNHVRCALQSTGKIVTPMQFVKNLKCISRSFRNYRQEDAHELMVNLLESMHKSCLPSGIPSQSPSAYEKSLVHRIFGGRLRSQVMCGNCSHCSSKFDPFLDLSLEIANAATLMKALQNFTKEELLDGGEEQYNCQSCKKKVVAKKRFTIDKAPDVLTIHLKRFSPFNPLHKIDKKVDFQPTLNLKPFVSNSEGMDFRYSLYGVLVHAGWNTQSGHYYCFVRTSSGMWHNLDDNQVRQVREADVLRQKAYMLFYVRDRVRNTLMFKEGASKFSEKNTIPEKIMEAMKSQKENLSNGHPTIFGNSSQGQCSKIPSNTDVMEAAAVQKNGMISVQKALGTQPDTVATLSINTNKTTSGSQREIISPPHLFGESTLAISKAAATAQEVKTEDTTVPDRTMSSREDLACCDVAKESTEPVNQHDEIVTDKELSAEHTDAITNTVEQTSVQTNTAEVGQATLNRLSVMDSDHIANPEEQASVQNNNLEAVQVNSEKHICSEVSAQAIRSEDAAPVICSEDSAQAICSEVSAHAIFSEVSAQAICSEDSAQVISSEVSAQAVCSEDSAKVICSEVSAQMICSEVSAQMICSEVSAHAICSEVSAHAICSEDSAQVICSEVSAEAICSEDSAKAICSEVSAQVICSEDSAQVCDKVPCHGNFTKTDLKSKRHVVYSTTQLLFMSKQPLRAALKLHKKRKHKGAKRQSTDNQNVPDDQQTSTSEPLLTKDISCKSHRRRKRSHASASSDDVDKMNSKKPHIAERSGSVDSGDKMNSKKSHLAELSSSAVDLPMDKKDDKDATLASAELPSSCVRSMADQTDSKDCAPPPNGTVSWHFDLLTRGLSEIKVQLWDDIDRPKKKAPESQHARTHSIGYVADEWDEEYDRGKRKKVRKPKEEEFGGPNPFQEVAEIRSRLRKRFKSDQSSWGNQPRML